MSAFFAFLKLWLVLVLVDMCSFSIAVHHQCSVIKIVCIRAHQCFKYSVRYLPLHDSLAGNVTTLHIVHLGILFRWTIAPPLIHFSENVCTVAEKKILLSLGHSVLFVV
jgi:hypothetical protein